MRTLRRDFPPLLTLPILHNVDELQRFPALSDTAGGLVPANLQNTHRSCSSLCSICSSRGVVFFFQPAPTQNVSPNASTTDESYRVHVMTDSVTFAARSDPPDGEALLRRRRAPSPEHVSPVQGREDSEYQVQAATLSEESPSTRPVCLLCIFCHSKQAVTSTTTRFNLLCTGEGEELQGSAK